MANAVLNTQKISGSAAVIGKHIDRESTAKHTYTQADPSRTHLNEDFSPKAYKELPLEDAVKLRIAESGAKERKDSVRALAIILTGSHEEMIDIFKDPRQKDAWLQANRYFVEKTFGKENVVRFTLHLDEHTPHVHAVIVPITQDGRLACKDFTGTPQKLSAMQTDYAELMKPFKLERGVIGSKAIHEEPARLLDKAVANNQKLEVEIQSHTRKNLLGKEEIDPKFLLEKVKELNTLNTALKEENKTIRRRISDSEKGREKETTKFKAEKRDIVEQKDRQISTLRNNLKTMVNVFEKLVRMVFLPKRLDPSLKDEVNQKRIILEVARHVSQPVIKEIYHQQKKIEKAIQIFFPQNDQKIPFSKLPKEDIMTLREINPLFEKALRDCIQEVRFVAPKDILNPKKQDDDQPRNIGPAEKRLLEVLHDIDLNRKEPTTRIEELNQILMDSARVTYYPENLTTPQWQDRIKAIEDFMNEENGKLPSAEELIEENIVQDPRYRKDPDNPQINEQKEQENEEKQEEKNVPKIRV